jgi:hypothetical protein
MVSLTLRLHFSQHPCILIMLLHILILYYMMFDISGA